MPKKSNSGRGGKASRGRKPKRGGKASAKKKTTKRVTKTPAKPKPKSNFSQNSGVQQPTWSLKAIRAEAKNNALIRDALKLYEQSANNSKVRAGARALIQAERLAQLKAAAAKNETTTPTPEDLLLALQKRASKSTAALTSSALPSTTVPPAAALPPPAVPAANEVPKFGTEKAPLLTPHFANATLEAKVKAMPSLNTNPTQRETVARYWGDLVHMNEIPEERYTFDWHCFGNSRKTGVPCGNFAKFGASWDGVCLPLLLGFPYCEKHISQYGGAPMVELYCKLVTPSHAARFMKNNGAKKF